jgi:hypothetical protein
VTVPAHAIVQRSRAPEVIAGIRRHDGYASARPSPTRSRAPTSPSRQQLLSTAAPCTCRSTCRRDKAGTRNLVVRQHNVSVGAVLAELFYEVYPAGHCGLSFDCAAAGTDKRLTVNSQHLSVGADSNEVRVSNPTLPESADDHCKAARLATALLRALASGFASAKRHHVWEHGSSGCA